ncbi:hypothetical protein PIB30_107446, partial [Stylosanthes scabra]|nr:hypothetical protein [Stylosanthes scabra]
MSIRFCDMPKDWMDLPRYGDEYIDGVFKFLEFELKQCCNDLNLIWGLRKLKQCCNMRKILQLMRIAVMALIMFETYLR